MATRIQGTRSQSQTAQSRTAPSVADLEEEVSRIYDLTSQSHDIEGKRFVFDGDTVPSVRRVCRQAVVDCGGKLGSSVDGSTDYLVVANEFGRDDEARRTAAELADRGGKVRVISLREFAYMAPPSVGEQVRRALDGCQFVEEDELRVQRGSRVQEVAKARTSSREFDPVEYENSHPWLAYLSSTVRVLIGAGLLVAAFWVGLFAAGGLVLSLVDGEAPGLVLGLFLAAVTAGLIWGGITLIRSGRGK